MEDTNGMCRRWRRQLLHAGIIALSLVATAGWSQTAATLAQQRSAFRTAYAAAQQGQVWQPLAKGLEAYPLYPYLEGAALQFRIAHGGAPQADVDAYLARYADLIPAADVRSAELTQLATLRDWKIFEHFWQPGLGDTLTCDHLQARLAAGQHLQFDTDLAALWQKTTLPDACTPVLDAASAQGLLTPARVWARIEAAADAGRADAIRQAAAWLPAGDNAEALRIAQALQSPADLLDSAPGLADTPRNREAISRAVARLARRDEDRAAAYWQGLAGKFQFGATDRDRALAAIALYDAIALAPDALSKLAALPASAQTDATREWRVRAAVAQGDWKAAQAALAALTPEEMQHDEWRYWNARVAQYLGDTRAAQAGYASLADSATFFGFLAADRARLAYSICPQTIALDPALDRQIETTPGFARAFEFFALDLLPQARREWNRAIATLPPAQQQQAVALASRKGWYDRPVFALGKSGDLDYYALRFPLADKSRVLEASRSAGIDPAWSYAIIRAESAWQTDAHSGANARGLMQLLPATAAGIARRNGLAYDGASSLYNPAINIPLGTSYLAHLAGRFDGSEWLASAAYNAGPGNVKRWIEARGSLDPERFILAIPFNETRAYVTRVLAFATLYGWRLDGKPIAVSARMPAIGAAFDPSAATPRAQVACRAPPAAPTSAALIGATP